MWYRLRIKENFSGTQLVVNEKNFGDAQEVVSKMSYITKNVV